MVEQEKTTSDQVREYLLKEGRMNRIHLEEFKKSFDNPKAAKTALDRFAIGTQVAINSKTKVYYAIKIVLEYAPGKSEDIYFALRGVPYELLILEGKKSNIVSLKIARLKVKYGQGVINYWAQSAQARTVVQAAGEMRKAKGHDLNKCPLCGYANQICKENGMTPMKKKNTSLFASHIISRRSIFWTILDQLDLDGHDIFSEEGTRELLVRLKQNSWMNDRDHIITLCHDHHKLLDEVIRNHADALVIGT